MARALVLCYHAVSEQWPADLSVTPSELERQLRDLLRRGYRPVTFSEAVTNGRDGRRVAVTFDDGFRSVGQVAAPILERLGVPATLFVVTDWVDSPTPMSWPGIESWLDGPHAQELAPISWTALRDLGDAGWEIGSHTRSHPRLTALERAALDRELIDSRRACEEHMERPCPAIAYPYGDVDARVVDRARVAGYRAGAALPARWHAATELCWPRAGVWQADDLRRFRVKTSAPVRLLRAAVRR